MRVQKSPFAALNHVSVWLVEERLEGTPKEAAYYCGTPRSVVRVMMMLMPTSFLLFCVYTTLLTNKIYTVHASQPPPFYADFGRLRLRLLYRI